MIGLGGQAAPGLEAVRHPVRRHYDNGILGQRQRLVVDAAVGRPAYQMRVGGPKAMRDDGSVVGEHGVEAPAIPRHHIGDGHADAAHEPELIWTRVEGPRRGHPPQLGAVHDPLLRHGYRAVEVQVHGQLLLQIVCGAYQMRDCVRQEQLRLGAAALKEAFDLQSKNLLDFASDNP